VLGACPVAKGTIGVSLDSDSESSGLVLPARAGGVKESPKTQDGQFWSRLLCHLRILEGLLLLLLLVVLWMALQARLTSTQASAELPKLFCWLTARPSYGAEIDLVRHQFRNQLGIFRCDAWAVYTPGEEPVLLGHKNNEAVFSIPFSVEGSKRVPVPGMPNTTIMANVDYMLHAWRMVGLNKDLAGKDYVVKPDPDTVFIPERLRAELPDYSDSPGAKRFFKNCEASNTSQGPLLMATYPAALEFIQKAETRCKNEKIPDYFNRDENGLPTYRSWEVMGDDGFFQTCMEELGVPSIKRFDLLKDAYCHICADGGEGCKVKPSCADGHAVAYHPFKGLDEWQQCYEDADS